MSRKEKERLQWEFRKLFPGYSALLDAAREADMFKNFEQNVENQLEKF